MAHTIRQKSDPVLRIVALPANPTEIPELAQALDKTLRRTGNAAGLALPQLGIPKQGFIIAARISKPAKTRFVFNPKILARSENLTATDEGCLSLPGEKYLITRHEAITVEYLNEKNRLVREHLTGLTARVFQHEFDHLQGILICDNPRPMNTPPISPTTYVHKKDAVIERLKQTGDIAFVIDTRDGVATEAKPIVSGHLITVDDLPEIYAIFSQEGWIWPRNATCKYIRIERHAQQLLLSDREGFPLSLTRLRQQ